ncbi:MAG: AAA family ATPase [Deltaproteobacteria bacterium]|jgi:hypothetical protein|nr:AAA family ATPase [Deltaproteobacteria bacterium]
MSRLPASLQSFREIREEGLAYADKTEHVHRLLMDGRGFRLTRPRSFGKTLLVSTLRALFRGRADLFKGLYLESSGWDFAPRPVVSLDFGRLGCASPAEAADDLCWELKRAAAREELTVKGASAGSLISWLVDALYAKKRRRPAVLVDNASAPLERRLGDPAGLEAMLAVFRGFWEALAAQGPRLRFVLAAGNFAFRGMTGPEGFLRDVSLGPRQALSCGFSDAEFDVLFREPLAEAAELMRSEGALPASRGAGDLRSEILRRYGGYSWDGETRAANPAAVISFFENSEHSWHFLEERPPDGIPRQVFAEAAELVPPGPELTFTRGLLNSLECRGPALHPLLFQAGALTVSGRRERDGVPEYSLGFPNREVEAGFRMLALAAMTGLDHAALRAHVRRFRNEAGEGRAEGAAAALAGLLEASEGALRAGNPRRGAMYALLLRLAGFEAPPPDPGQGIPGLASGCSGASGAAGWAAGSLRFSGGRRIQVILRHIPGAESLGEGAARRLLQESLDAALREAADGEAPPERIPPGAAGPSWETRRLYVFTAGQSETAGAAAGAGCPLLFRPLAKAAEEGP